MKDDNFGLYSKYYNLLYQKKKYFEEANYISDCIKEFLPSASTILDFGSGTGRHGLVLQKLGYDIFGIEKSKQMVDKALENGFSCEQGDIIDFNSKKTYDVITSLFHVISYINDNASLIKVFSNAFSSLNNGGLFIFDTWYSPAVYYQKPEARIKKIETEEIIVLRYAEPEIHTNKNTVDVNYSVLVRDKIGGQCIEFQEKHPMRHFSIPEIRLIANFTGFDLIKAEEFLTKNQPSINTWGVNFILKKNE